MILPSLRASFAEQCERVIANCPDEFARAYARAGLDHCFTREAIHSQILYILNNLSRWRGVVASDCRGQLRNLLTQSERNSGATPSAETW